MSCKSWAHSPVRYDTDFFQNHSAIKIFELLHIILPVIFRNNNTLYFWLTMPQRENNSSASRSSAIKLVSNVAIMLAHICTWRTAFTENYSEMGHLGK